MFSIQCLSKLNSPQFLSSIVRHIRTEAIQPSLRNLLRKVAQPVVVITSLLDHDKGEPLKYHGATLSSFSSVAMDPHPLVAFSLRNPSRMAASIHEAFSSSPLHPTTPHIVVNLLSSTQSDVAIRFSRPDLHPFPFENTEWHLSKEGLPIITGSLGAVSCSVVAATRLDTFGSELEDNQFDLKNHSTLQQTAPIIVSELFLARVLRIEDTQQASSDDQPLVYHDRKYMTTSTMTSSQA